MAVCSVNFPMLFSRYFYPVFDRYKCVYVTSNLFIYSACIWRWGSLQRGSGTPGSFWRHTACRMLPARSAPGPSSLGTQTSRAPGVWHLKPLCLRGIESEYPFCYIYFHPSFELEYTGEFQSREGFDFSFSFYHKLFHFYMVVRMICWVFFFIG